MQIEVEFFPIYKNQPLFGDIDHFVRLMGFSLFDLSRYRLRRSNIKTRGQLLWGHAFYLKDISQIEGYQPADILKLAAIASFFGFEDYAVEVLGFIIARDSEASANTSIERIKPIIKACTENRGYSSLGAFQRLLKKDTHWMTSPRKDRGYFLKD